MKDLVIDFKAELDLPNIRLTDEHVSYFSVDERGIEIRFVEKYEHLYRKYKRFISQGTFHHIPWTAIHNICK